VKCRGSRLVQVRDSPLRPGLRWLFRRDSVQWSVQEIRGSGTGEMDTRNTVSSAAADRLRPGPPGHPAPHPISRPSRFQAGYLPCQGACCATGRVRVKYDSFVNPAIGNGSPRSPAGAGVPLLPVVLQPSCPACLQAGPHTPANLLRARLPLPGTGII